VCDGGEFGQWAQAVLSPDIINGPSGAIGGAVPSALAAKLAHPERPVIALTGDGAFGFHAMEFDTAVRYNLPIMVIIGNDAAWNAEKQIQIRRFGAGRTFACDLLPSRYDKMVEALGGHGEFVESPSEVSSAIDRALRSGKPACVNVRIQSVPAP
jgi:acetolactate synthase-1/2/3 large subunit